MNYLNDTHFSKNPTQLVCTGKKRPRSLLWNVSKNVVTLKRLTRNSK